jgi:hypothetical protein
VRHEPLGTTAVPPEVGAGEEEDAPARSPAPPDDPFDFGSACVQPLQPCLCGARVVNARDTIELAIPKLRAGSYFPDWLLQPRRRAEQAFVSVIADAYLAGVSTRRVRSSTGTSPVAPFGSDAAAGRWK